MKKGCSLAVLLGYTSGDSLQLENCEGCQSSVVNHCIPFCPLLKTRFVGIFHSYPFITLQLLFISLSFIAEYNGKTIKQAP